MCRILLHVNHRRSSTFNNRSIIVIAYDSKVVMNNRWMKRWFWRNAYGESCTYATLGGLAWSCRCLFAISSKSQEFESRRTSAGTKTCASILFERIDARVIWENVHSWSHIPSWRTIWKKLMCKVSILCRYIRRIAVSILISRLRTY